MACDTQPRRGQTLSERKAEVRKVISEVDKLIAQRRVLVKIGPQGGVAFTGVPDEQRSGVTDACIYRHLMVSGSALAKAELMRAEQLAGRAVDKQAVAQGHHSHDGGKTWHHGH